MSATVWKKELILGVTTLDVPEDTEFLCAMEQHGGISVWFRCDPSKSVKPRRFTIVGTGHAAPDASEADYVDTVKMMDGHLMLHVFVEKRIVPP